MKQPFPSDHELIADIQAGGPRRERAATLLYDHCLGFYIKQQREYPRFSQTDLLSSYGQALADLINMVIKRTFRKKSKLSTALFRIYKNKCIDMLRQDTTYKSERRKDAMWEIPENLSDPTLDGEAQMISEEFRQRLLAMFQAMSERCRELLTLWLFYEYSNQELREEMQLSSDGSLRSTKTKCRDELKKRLRTDPNE